MKSFIKEYFRALLDSYKEYKQRNDNIPVVGEFALIMLIIFSPIIIAYGYYDFNKKNK